MNRGVALARSPIRSDGYNPTKKRVSFILPTELDNLLELYCNTQSETKNELTARALQEFLGNRKVTLNEALKAKSNAIRRLIPEAENPDVAPAIALPPAGLTVGIFGEGAQQARIVAVSSLANDLVRRLLHSPEDMFHLTPPQFEELIMDRIVAMGCEVEQAGKTNEPDGGVDFVFWPRPGNGPIFLGAVQVKHHATRKRKSGVEVVHSMAGVLQRHHGTFNLGMVVTNTSFTKEAHWWVDPFKLFLRLRDGADILKWVEDDFSAEQNMRDFPPGIQLTRNQNLRLRKRK